MKIHKVLILFFLLLGCKDSYYWRKDFDNHTFDRAVITHISLYDTLRQTILKNYSEFPWHNTQGNLVYIYNFDTSYNQIGINSFDIPIKIRSEIILLFNKLGQENIMGFTIAKDSSFKIFVRNTFLDTYDLDVRESLIWYPQITKIEKLEFPFKDTLLSEKWQYEIWYDKRSEF